MRKFHITILLLMTSAALTSQNAAPNAATPLNPAQNAVSASAHQYTITPAGQEDPGSKRAREVIDRTIQALGGDAFMHPQGLFYEGRASGFNKHGELNGMQDVRVWKFGDKQRVERVKVPGWVTIFSGDKGWDVTFHGTDPIPAKDMQRRQRVERYSMNNVLRNWVRDPKTIYFFNGEKYAESRQCYSITLINAQNQSVDMLVESGTYLPIKNEWAERDPEYQEKTEESSIYDKYRNVQGIQTPFIVSFSNRGQMLSQTFITTAKYEPMSDSIFTPESKQSAPH
ncbi:MAG TPA: hypothetical protein VGC88_05575 [Terriglobales bacterium]